MFASLHAVWKSLIHWLTAFACAVEPCELSEPVAHEMALAPPLLVVVVGVELLSEPHAVSASVAVSVRPARALYRWSFTSCSLRVRGWTDRHGAAGRQPLMVGGWFGR